MSKSNSQVIEGALGLRLPESYRLFLDTIGFISDDGTEIYGFDDRIKDPSRLPSVLAAVQIYGDLYSLQKGEIPIAIDSQSEALWILDADQDLMFRISARGERFGSELSFRAWLEQNRDA